MSETVATKLPPFHKTVLGALGPEVIVSVCGSERRQGRVEEALRLISGSEIPMESLPGVIAACANAQRLLEFEASAGPFHRVAIADLIRKANEIMVSLNERLRQKQAEESKRRG